MAAFSALTAEQQAAIVDHVDTLVRPTVLHAAGSVKRMGAALTDAAARGIAALLDGLDAGAVIPAASGLAGASPLTREDVQSLLADMGSIAATFNTPEHAQLWSRAAGAVNVLNA